MSFMEVLVEKEVSFKERFSVYEEVLFRETILADKDASIETEVYDKEAYQGLRVGEEFYIKWEMEGMLEPYVEEKVCVEDVPVEEVVGN